ncbi:MAG: DUF503 domain-containing protein [Limnochordales bacterium]|nr:DUF503 domain-containing protein [Bacillota bacterium]
MVVGLLTLELYIHDSASLKAKRRAVRSLYDRIRTRFNVSVAEVGNHDAWQRATLAVAVATTDASQAYRVLSAVVDFVQRDGSVELSDYAVELR